MTSCNRQIDDTFWPKITAFYTIFPPISRLHFFMFFRDSFGFGNLQGIRICTIAIFWILKFRNLSKFRLERANIGKCDNLSIFRPFPHNNVVSRYIVKTSLCVNITGISITQLRLAYKTAGNQLNRFCQQCKYYWITSLHSVIG